MIFRLVKPTKEPMNIWKTNPGEMNPTISKRRKGGKDYAINQKRDARSG